MKKLKKVIIAVMAFSLAFSFAACGKNSADSTSAPGNGKNSIKTEDGSFILKNEESVELGTPEKILNPEEVYGKITYTPEMFYGRYSLKNWFKDGNYDSEEMNVFKSSTDYMDDPYSEENAKLSKLPISVEAGIETPDFGLKYETKFDWISFSFFSEKGYPQDYQFAYEIEGNKLKLTGVRWSFDNDTRELKYKIDESVKLEYEFKFNGRTLELMSNGKSVILYSGYDYSGEEDYLYCNNYVSAGSKQIDNVQNITFRWTPDGESHLCFEYKSDKGTEYIKNCVAELSENGLFTFTVPYETRTKTYQFVYILCAYDGIILTDGDNTYYYMDSFQTFHKNSVSKNVEIEQLETLEDMSETEIKALEEKKTNLFADLTNAFNETGITVQVNESTGEIAMDSTVLFGGDSAVVTDEGKAFLNKFIKAYTSIIYSEKYDGFISKTMVEGHIAPVDGTTYEGGMPLSEERAKNVKEYCLSSETGVDTSKLSSALETVGYSQSRPVYDSDGNIDIAASRRVSFRFIINIDN